MIVRVLSEQAERPPRLTYRSAAVCAFSVPFRMTQRDADRAGTCRAVAPSCGPPACTAPANPPRRSVGPAACRRQGPLDDPGLASVPQPWTVQGLPAPGRPGVPPRASAASRHPGRAPVHALRREPRPASLPRVPGPCSVHDGRGCTGSPGSEYYGGSPSSRAGRPTAGPARIPRWPRRTGQTGTVPVFTAIRSTKEEPSSIPAASPRLPRSTSPWPPRPTSASLPESSPLHRANRNGCAPRPAPIRQI